MNIWDDKEELDKLEEQRTLKRLTDRLTFDCLNTVSKGDRVYCSKGRRLGQSRAGSLALITVLRGISSGSCRDCENFTTEE